MQSISGLQFVVGLVSLAGGVMAVGSVLANGCLFVVVVVVFQPPFSFLSWVITKEWLWDLVLCFP